MENTDYIALIKAEAKEKAAQWHKHKCEECGFCSCLQKGTSSLSCFGCLKYQIVPFDFGKSPSACPDFVMRNIEDD